MPQAGDAVANRADAEDKIVRAERRHLQGIARRVIPRRRNRLNRAPSRAISFPATYTSRASSFLMNQNHQIGAASGGNQPQIVTLQTDRRV